MKFRQTTIFSVVLYGLGGQAIAEKYGNCGEALRAATRGQVRRTKKPGSVRKPGPEATAGFEPAVGVLQTPALPLGYVAVTVMILAYGRHVVKPNRDRGKITLAPPGVRVLRAL